MDAEDPRGSPHTTAEPAVVVASGLDGTRTLELGDGRTVEVSGPEAVIRRLRIGRSAWVFFDREGRLTGWRLPDQQLGVDYRPLDGEER